MTPEQRQRRIKAADFLDNLQIPTGDRFDMSDFGYFNGCGTAACAVGWMAIKGLFPEFTARPEPYYKQFFAFELNGKPINACTAAEKLFGDDTSDFWWPSVVRHILDPEGERGWWDLSPQEVATAIRKDLGE